MVSLVFLIKKAGIRKLSPPLWVPMMWMIFMLSRSLTQWLEYRGDFSGMDAEMEGSPIDAAFLLILVILGLRILYVRKIDIKGVIKNSQVLIIFYGFALISLLWADFPFIGLKRWIRWFGSLVMVFVILSDESPKAAINSLIKRCAYILIPLSIIFVKFVPRLGRSYSRRGFADYHGVATHKNGYGVLLLIFGLYLTWELINSWRRKDYPNRRKIRYINSILLLVIFWQLFFIDSKTSIICLLLGIGSLMWLSLPSSQKSPKRAKNYIIAFAIIVLILQQFVDIRSATISAASRDPTLSDRANLWAAVLAVPINPWIGTGWDNFWLGDRIVPIWERWQWQPRSAHNGYLEIYLYLGLAGIVLLLFVLLWIYKKSTALLVYDFEYGYLSLSFFIITLFYNYTESGFHRMHPMWFFLLLFTCLPLPRKREKGEKENLLLSESDHF